MTLTRKPILLFVIRYLILKLCVGTVAHYIKGTYKGQMPSQMDGMIQMASGLQYIHSRHLVHRDIKPENVLISPSFVLKISDFGTSRTVTTTSKSFSMSSGAQGTRVYYSPEFLSSEEKSQEEKEEIRANVLIDVFSLGCLFFSYITMGGHPFADGGSPIETQTTTNIRNDKKVLSGEKGKKISIKCELITRMKSAGKLWNIFLFRDTD